MPCSYTLHRTLRTLHCQFSGHISLREGLALIDRAGADPEHEDGTNVIADLLGVTRLDMDWGSQRDMMNRLAALSSWTGLPRSCALLVQGEPVWSFAGSIVQTITLKSPVVFGRVSTPAEALAFVGLDPRQHAERFGYAPVY